MSQIKLFVSLAHANALLASTDEKRCSSLSRAVKVLQSMFTDKLLETPEKRLAAQALHAVTAQVLLVELTHLVQEYSLHLYPLSIAGKAVSGTHIQCCPESMLCTLVVQALQLPALP